MTPPKTLLHPSSARRPRSGGRALLFNFEKGC